MIKRPNNTLKISELARAFSITTRSIRYYEEEGLLLPSYVDVDSSYRYYGQEAVMRLSLILKLRNAGMTISQLKQYFGGRLDIKNTVRELYSKIEEATRDSVSMLPFCRYNQQEPIRCYFARKYCVKTVYSVKKTMDIESVVESAAESAIREGVTRGLHILVSEPCRISIENRENEYLCTVFLFLDSVSPPQDAFVFDEKEVIVGYYSSRGNRLLAQKTTLTEYADKVGLSYAEPAFYTVIKPREGDSDGIYGVVLPLKSYAL